MIVCTFFGHRECFSLSEEKLRRVIEELIVEDGVDMFYVGNQGKFDACVRKSLKKLSTIYPIQYAVVLAYMPRKGACSQDAADTMLPEGIECVHPKYAIHWRNKWMLDRADIVVTYIEHSWGGAYQYARRACRMGKRVINVAG